MANKPETTVVGNLTADPELRYTSTGTAYCKFTVAGTPSHFDKTLGKFVDGETLFMRCTAWRALAEHLAESMTIGQRLIVSGRLEQNNWVDDDGNKHSLIVLNVDEAGPSLLFATAVLTKASGKSSAGKPKADDPWATSEPGEKQLVGAGPAGFDDPPPF